MLATDEFKLLGSSPFLIPAGLCLAIWIWIGRARKMAATWTTLFGACLFVVAASKMAYIGWGFEIHAIDFQGFSGHAMRAAAVFPAFLYLVLHDSRGAIRAAGVASGLGFGMLMAVAVSVYDTHSASESIGGFLLGAATSLCFIRTTRSMQMPVLDTSRTAVISLCGIGALAGAIAIKSDPTYRWLEHAALYLSGNDKPFSRQQPSSTSQ